MKDIDAKASFVKTFKPQPKKTNGAVKAFEPHAPVVSNVPAVSSVPNVSLDSGAIDFKALLGKAVGIIQEQSLVGVDPSSITLKSMELSKAKANSLIEALHNIILVTHTSEILSADSQKFKRAEEMGVLGPLLKSFGEAARAGEKSMQILVKKLSDAEESMREVSGSLEEEETKARILNHMQTAYGACIDNLNKIVAGTARLIQLERFSQGRPWGAAGVRQGNMGYIEKLDPAVGVPEAGAVGATPARRLTREEIEGAFKE